MLWLALRAPWPDATLCERGDCPNFEPRAQRSRYGLATWRLVACRPWPSCRFTTYRQRFARAAPAPRTSTKNRGRASPVKWPSRKVGIDQIITWACRLLSLHNPVGLWLALRAPWRDATQRPASKQASEQLSRAAREGLYWFSKLVG